MNRQKAGIIMEPMRLREVDVRDMLCAQALAVVAEAMAQLKAGEEGLDVRISTDDVQQDLQAWAKQKQYSSDVLSPLRLRICL